MKKSLPAQIASPRNHEGRELHPAVPLFSNPVNPVKTGVRKRAAILIGPEFGTVQRADLVADDRKTGEAGDAGFDALVAWAFNYEAHTTEFSKLGRLPVLKARMNADLHRAEDLKNTGKGNRFVNFGEPYIEVVSGLWLVARGGRLAANYVHVKDLSGLGSLEEINRLDGADLPRFKTRFDGGAARTDQPGAASSGVGAVQLRGGNRQDGAGGISAKPERGHGIDDGSGNATDHRESTEVASAANARTASAPLGGNQQGDESELIIGANK